MDGAWTRTPRRLCARREPVLRRAHSSATRKLPGAHQILGLGNFRVDSYLGCRQRDGCPGPSLGRVRHLRPAGTVHGRHCGFVAHPALTGSAFLRVPPLSVAIRPDVLPRHSGGAVYSRPGQVRSVHRRRQVVRHLRFDRGITVFHGSTIGSGQPPVNPLTGAREKSDGGSFSRRQTHRIAGGLAGGNRVGAVTFGRVLPRK